MGSVRVPALGVHALTFDGHSLNGGPRCLNGRLVGVQAGGLGGDARFSGGKAGGQFVGRWRFRFRLGRARRRGWGQGLPAQLKSNLLQVVEQGMIVGQAIKPVVAQGQPLQHG